MGVKIVLFPASSSSLPPSGFETRRCSAPSRRYTIGPCLWRNSCCRYTAISVPSHAVVSFPYLSTDDEPTTPAISPPRHQLHPSPSSHTGLSITIPTYPSRTKTAFSGTPTFATPSSPSSPALKPSRTPTPSAHLVQTPLRPLFLHMPCASSDPASLKTTQMTTTWRFPHTIPSSTLPSFPCTPCRHPCQPAQATPQPYPTTMLTTDGSKASKKRSPAS